MSFIFKSKLYRNEIKHWILICSLTLWALTASVYALSKSEKVIVIGIDDAGTRLVTASSDRLLQSELKSFLRSFFDNYYVYDEKNFLEQVGKATELMTDDLWLQNKDRLFDLHQKLQKSPLSQTMEIEKIDLIEQGKVEAILEIKVHARLSEQKLKLKVRLEYHRRDRDEKNPWSFEVTSINDEIL